MAAMARTREFDIDEAIEQIARKFWADGYEATGIADLVEATGVGRASLYGAFGSKREMLSRSIDWYMSERIERMLGSVETGGLDAAASIFRSFTYARERIPEMAALGCMVINTTVELTPTDPDIATLAGDYRDRFRKAFRTALTSAEADREIAEPIEEKVEIATLMLLGLFVAMRGGATLEETTNLVDGTISVLDSWRVATP